MHVSADQLLCALRRSGLRLTAARRAVCEVLALSHDDHLTAAGLRERAERVAGRPIDPSTIYRTIEALESAGHLHHVHLGHGPSVVHLSDRLDHHHLVCEVCGRTVDVPLEDLAEAGRLVEDRYGFIADSVHFALVGRCSGHAGAR
jgi:Fur family ferric uptake transcriptional regulator